MEVKAIARQSRLRVLVSGLLIVTGLLFLIQGGYLALLGGATYYVVAGVGILASGVLIYKSRLVGAWLFCLVYTITLGWTVWEVGSRIWGWVPRVGYLTVLAVLVCIVLPELKGGKNDPVPRLFWRKVLIGLCGMCSAIAFGLAWIPQETSYDLGNYPSAEAKSPAETDKLANVDWSEYGNKNATRYSQLNQINTNNVRDLKVAWVYRTGDLPPKGKTNKWAAETTPIKVGDGVYICTATNNLAKLDPVSGKPIWTFDAGTKYESVPYTAACRGVSYYRSEITSPDVQCHNRIVESTLDMRLIAVDADTGKPCQQFGENGQVNLLKGLGETVPGFVASTSPPVIVNGAVIVNHQVLDGQKRWAPSGVIRGYSADTGALLWAWDVNRPGVTTEPEPGEEYSRGTPNSWGPMTGDEQLGLVYVPMGNSAADYYSALRSENENRVSSSVVALDATTGKERWVFQTVHKDVWDYDIGSQSTLFDFADKGEKVPAIIIPTKRGQTFVLDRRSGKPLTAVEERPAPAGNVPGDPRSPTQPWSVGMPRLGFSDLTEEKMWGMTPFDQMYCRTKFKQAHYVGEFTPPVIGRPWIEYPGYNGGSDWGSVSYDPLTGVLIANWNNTPMYDQLLSREESDRRGLRPIDDPKFDTSSGGAEGAGAMAETPYGIDVAPFLMPLTQVLCNEPPFGMITAINMKNQKVIWQKPLGTARANGPFGLPTYLPVEVGTPNNGGPIITAGGLVFIAAATDGLIRAIDMKTGKTVWNDVLPAGGQATPMTYSINGKQYLVITAGGHHFMRTPVGDYVIAYALPE
ncbi:membrane-bound PQQ-dependent dehydrogenase, glucose/quinate/shikimate family [Pseudomonas chlororaphis]|uniref:membrane-bound PQQ-dependent dehydrogenase, glucose/quinate/shikimate family n=1 Tax=Pseudomonas chlororaphis TaxID=587753 RepID=UPI00352B642F